MCIFTNAAFCMGFGPSYTGNWIKVGIKSRTHMMRNTFIWLKLLTVFFKALNDEKQQGSQFSSAETLEASFLHIVIK